MTEPDRKPSERRRRALIARHGVRAVFPSAPGEPIRRLDADLVRLHDSLFVFSGTVSRARLSSLSGPADATPAATPPGEERIFGRMSALAGADVTPQRLLRLAYLPAAERPPSPELLELLERVRPREPDLNEVASWLPLDAILAGDISIMNVEALAYDWPLIRYTILHGTLDTHPVHAERQGS
jgi:hypothetical protein